MSEARNTTINLIVACGRGGVIGLKGEMPWHLPEDLAYFKRITMGCPVIMGRNTWDSIVARGGALRHGLPGRTNIVVTRNPNWAGAGDAWPAHSVAEAIELAKKTEAHDIFIIGGAQIYAAALNATQLLVQRAYVTEIDATFAGDAFFTDTATSAWQSAWHEVSRETHASAQLGGGVSANFAFVVYAAK